MTRLAFTCAVALIASGCALLYPVRKDETTSSPAGAGGSGGGAGPEPDVEAGTPAACHNAQCSMDWSDTGAPWICQRGCVVSETENCCRQLKTDDCPIVYPPEAWRDDNAIIFGAYARLDPIDSVGRSDEAINYKMALDELKADALPDSKDKKHPLVAVICNNDSDVAAQRPDFYPSTLDHLVKTVGVDAIIASLPTSALLDDFRRTQQMNKNVFFLSTGAANDQLVRFDEDQGRIWNLIGAPHDLVAGYQWLGSRIETYVRKTDPAATAVRVAMVTSSNLTVPELEELRAGLRTELVFNGAGTKQNGANQLYKEFVVPPGTQDFMPMARDILDFDPHIVISMLEREFTQYTQNMPGKGLLQSLTFLDKDLTYPFYILSPVNKGAAVQDIVPLLNLAANDPAMMRERLLRERLLGINPADTEDRDLLNDYRTQLATYSQQTAGRMAGTGWGTAYDAIYYLAYALAFTGIETPYDGVQLSAGMGRLTFGEPHRVGRNDIQGVLGALSNGAITLIGVSGSHFDASKGVRSNSTSLFCFTPNTFGERTLRDPAEIYDPTTKTQTALYRCGPATDF